MDIILIVALDRADAIGRDNKLPWHLPDDLRRFKALTTGQTILMGRRTYDSIGHALPNRRNLVLTRNPGFTAPDVEVVHSLEQALALASDPLFVIGGGAIYALAMPLATRLVLTRVETLITDADTHFPPWEPAEWREVLRSSHPIDARHALAFTFHDLVRVSPPADVNRG